MNIISFVYSKRWLEVTLLSETKYRSIFYEKELVKKIELADFHKKIVSKLVNLANKFDHNNFILKLNISVLLSQHLDFILNELPINKSKQIPIDNLIQKIENILSTDFETPFRQIYAFVEDNGFSERDFSGLFKQKNGVSLLEFRQTKKMEFSVKLLKNGLQIKDVAAKTGFKTTTKFIELFRKTYGEPPKSYLKNLG